VVNPLAPFAAYIAFASAVTALILAPAVIENFPGGLSPFDKNLEMVL
jgi:hypothetical protein